MKILSLIAAVESIVSHGGKAEKTSAVRVCTPRQYRDLIEAAKFKPPTHMKLRWRAA